MELKSSEATVPTATFRRAAWQRFQLALDPLGSPHPLRSAQEARPVGEPFGTSRAA